ncbi:MAG: hypothetical protein FJ333_08720 [Sphingomonadales bacterium]|nr:hypothetical protein [Sphingomonadales bacterium]
MTKSVNRVDTVSGERCRLMIALLDRAGALNGLSRRQMACQLGVSVGTVNAYYLRRVDPFHCRMVIQKRLGDLNGTSLDDVYAFYASGDWQLIGAGSPVLAKPVSKPLRRPRSKVGYREPSPLLEAGFRCLSRQRREGESAPLPTRHQIQVIAALSCDH